MSDDWLLCLLAIMKISVCYTIGRIHRDELFGFAWHDKGPSTQQAIALISGYIFPPGGILNRGSTSST